MPGSIHRDSTGVHLDGGRLHRAPHCDAGPQPELGGGRRGDVGHDLERLVENGRGTRSGARSMSITTACQQLRTLPWGSEVKRVTVFGLDHADRGPGRRRSDLQLTAARRDTNRPCPGADRGADLRRGAPRRTAIAAVPDLVGASDLHDSAAVDHDDAIGQRQRLERIVRHQHQHAVEGRELIAKLAAHVDAGLGIEGREGFVEQQRPRGSTASARPARRAGPGRRRARAAWRAARSSPSRARHLAAPASLAAAFRIPRACAAERHVVERVRWRNSRPSWNTTPTDDPPGYEHPAAGSSSTTPSSPMTPASIGFRPATRANQRSSCRRRSARRARRARWRPTSQLDVEIERAEAQHDACVETGRARRGHVRSRRSGGRRTRGRPTTASTATTPRAARG